MNIDIRHVDVVLVIDDVDERVVILRAYTLVEILDDRHEMRNSLIQVVSRPLLKSLCEDRVVRVAADVRDNLNCLIRANAVLAENADQLRDDHRRVRIVDLDRAVVRKIMQVRALCLRLIEHELNCICDHEIFLIDAEDSALLIGVIRIEEQSQVLRDLRLVK